MPADAPPGHRGARRALALLVFLTCAAGVAAVVLTGVHEDLYATGVRWAGAARALWG